MSQSSSSDSSSSSSESSSPSGFAFNGTVYLNYQEMVAAKRERNRNFLQKSVDELSVAFGRDPGDSKKSDDNTRRSNNKRKRRGSNQSASCGSGKSSRRNPKRATRGTGTGTTSSISSQSHVSSFHRSRRISRLKIPIPPVPGGKKEIREACPQIGPGWVMRVRARNVVSARPGPVSDRVFISPTGRILRGLKDVESFMEGEPILSGNETDADRSVSVGDASSFSASWSRRTDTANALHQNSMQKMVSKSPDAVDGLTEELLKIASATKTDRSSFPKSVMMAEDESAAVEHVLLNGGRVQAREVIWRDFIQSDTILGGENAKCKTIHAKKDISKRNIISVNEEEALDSRKKERLIHLSDWKLYYPIIAQSDLNNVKNDMGGLGGFRDDDDDDDIAIPDEFLMDETMSEADNIICHPEGQHLMPTEILPINNHVKYNNIIRERHSYYTLKGPDRHWDQEFGDGIDPMTFAVECRRGNGTATGDEAHTICTDGDSSGPEKNRNDQGSDTKSSMEKRYISSLLQRCWDRAVHASSSTVTVSATGGHQVEMKTTLDANSKREGRDLKGPNQAVVDSRLRHEAMNVVDGLLGVLVNDRGITPTKINDSVAENISADWRHVLKCLQSAARRREKKKNQKGIGPVIRAIEKRRPLSLNHISLKALSMRLIERYGDESHKIPL